MAEPKKFSLAYRDGDVFWFYAPDPEPQTVAWSDIEGKPETFPPEDHTHEPDPVEETEEGDPEDDFLFNAIKDNDGRPIKDNDGGPIYDNSSTKDNSRMPTRFFDTVEEMVAFETPWTLDRCVTLGYASGPSDLLHWVMVANPFIVPNQDTRLLSFQSYGIFVRIPQG